MSDIWRDPFGEKKKNSTPTLFVPIREAPPPDLKDIRKKQRKILPYLAEFIASGQQAVEKVSAIPGGDILIGSISRHFMATVLYRPVDYPSLVQQIAIPLKTASVPVIFPASMKAEIPILDYLFPTQTIADLEHQGLETTISASAAEAVMASGKVQTTPIPPDLKRAILAAEKEMGLVRDMALSSSKEKTDEPIIVVHLETARFAYFWIKKMKSPIDDIDFVNTKPAQEIRPANFYHKAEPSATPRYH